MSSTSSTVVWLYYTAKLLEFLEIKPTKSTINKIKICAPLKEHRGSNWKNWKKHDCRVEIRRSSSLRLTPEGVVCGILVSSISNFQRAFYAISLTDNNIKYFWLSPTVQKPHLLNRGNNYLRKTLGRLTTSREEGFLEKLTMPLIAQKFWANYAVRSFFAVVRNITAYPHSEPNQSSPRLPTLFSEVYINIISLLYNGYRVLVGGKVRPGPAADHSPPSSATVMEE